MPLYPWGTTLFPEHQPYIFLLKFVSINAFYEGSNLVFCVSDAYIGAEEGKSKSQNTAAISEEPAERAWEIIYQGVIYALHYIHVIWLVDVCG